MRKTIFMSLALFGGIIAKAQSDESIVNLGISHPILKSREAIYNNAETNQTTDLPDVTNIDFNSVETLISSEGNNDYIISKSSNDEWRKKGYRGYFEGGYTSTLDDNGYYTWGLLTSHGYQINPRHFVGAGVGVIGFNHKLFELESSTPLFANYRYNMLKSKVSPFLDVKLGYSPSNINGGFFAFSAGCDIALAPKFDLYASIVYMAHDTDLKDLNGSKTHSTLNFLGFHIGLNY